MINRIITWSLEYRKVVVFITSCIIGLGIYTATRTPVDAIPDLSTLTLD